MRFSSALYSTPPASRRTTRRAAHPVRALKRRAPQAVVRERAARVASGTI